MRRRQQDGWDAPPPAESRGPFGRSPGGGLSGPEPEGPGHGDDAWSASDMAAYHLRREQNLFAGVVAGLVAGGATVAAWVAVAAETGAPIPFMALGVGYLVGFAVRWAGHGVDRSFGIAAGLITLAGCVAGTVLSVSAILAAQEGVSLAEFMEDLDVGLVLHMLLQSVGPIGAVIWLFAIYESFRVATVTPPTMTLPSGEHDDAFEREQHRQEPSRHD